MRQRLRVLTVDADAVPPDALSVRPIGDVPAKDQYGRSIGPKPRLEVVVIEREAEEPLLDMLPLFLLPMPQPLPRRRLDHAQRREHVQSLDLEQNQLPMMRPVSRLSPRAELILALATQRYAARRPNPRPSRHAQLRLEHSRPAMHPALRPSPTFIPRSMSSPSPSAARASAIGGRAGASASAGRGASSGPSAGPR